MIILQNFAKNTNIFNHEMQQTRKHSKTSPEHKGTHRTQQNTQNTEEHMYREHSKTHETQHNTENTEKQAEHR